MEFANPPNLARVNNKITGSELRAFGLGSNRNSLQIVENFEDLRKNPPNMVIVESKIDIRFTQNKFKVQELKKKGKLNIKKKYVMSLGVYNQLKLHPYNQKKMLVPASMKFNKIYNPYIGQDLSGKTLLVWRTGGIGDLLFIQPSLIYLKKKYPTCHIKFSCGPQYQSLVDNWDCIDELLDLPFNVKHLLQSNYHATFEGVIERCKQAHTTCSYILFSKWLGLDIPEKELVPKLKTKPDKINECKKILQNWNISPKKFIVVQMRASSPVRSPSLIFWRNVINYLNIKGYHVVLTDNPRMSDNIDSFIKTLSKPRMCMNYAKHSKTLDYSIALISLSSMVISTDSSMCHIAGALDVPIYGIYGPFPGKIRLSTFRKAIWIDAPAKCSPCYLHGHRSCPNSIKDGSSSCFMNINIIESMEQALEFLKRCENNEI